MTIGGPLHRYCNAWNSHICKLYLFVKNLEFDSPPESVWLTSRVCTCLGSWWELLGLAFSPISEPPHQYCCVRFIVIANNIIVSTVLLIRFGRKTICLAACLAITIFGSFTSLSSSMPVWDADFGDGDDYEDDCEWWCMFIWFCTGYPINNQHHDNAHKGLTFSSGFFPWRFKFLFLFSWRFLFFLRFLLFFPEAFRLKVFIF